MPSGMMLSTRRTSPLANHIVKKSVKSVQSVVWIYFRGDEPRGCFGIFSAVKCKNTPGRIRTCNLRFRRPPLYPIELLARINLILTHRTQNINKTLRLTSSSNYFLKLNPSGRSPSSVPSGTKARSVTRKFGSVVLNIGSTLIPISGCPTGI